MNQDPPSATRDIIYAWADNHLECKDRQAIYPMWETTFYIKPHLLTKLRLCGNCEGADIVILSCSASYGASEDDWKGCNVGHCNDVNQIVALYQWMKERSERSAQ